MRITLLTLLLAVAPLSADEELFLERFADPSTRSTAIAELVPGTQSAYFHTALDHQLAGRDEEFRKTMAAWKAASEQKENPVSDKSMKVLENRQLFIAYQKDPLASLVELIRRFNLDFSDTRPDAAAAAESLPTRLDPALISEAAFEKKLTDDFPDAPYARLTRNRLLRELEQVETFDDAKIRWFVENLNRADLPGVIPLLDRSLSLTKPVAFDSHPIHKLLTATQLESLLELHPVLRSNESFALAYLEKLRPGAETDFKREPKAHAEHLRRCRDFAVTLPPALNSLKAHVLFHHLRVQEELGNYLKEDLLAYLALPRARHDLIKPQESATPATVNTDADFSAVTSCPPVRDDTSLVEAWIMHFLSQSESAAEFAPFIPDKTLTRLHAHAQLLAGSDPNRWGSMIDPAEFKTLQTETRLTFAPGAPSLLEADETVNLTLDLKNTRELLIRVYELDLPAHLAKHPNEQDVNINLDGLVPHLQRRLTFGHAPILLRRKTIDLPELAGPGRWLIDFTSGQVSARALIRKGSLTPYIERTATGQCVRIFDEKGNPVPNAKITLGLEVFETDPSGQTLIPNAPNQPVTRSIVTAGKLAAPIVLDSREDRIALDARFHLDREQLLADQEARLHLRMRLTNHGHEIPLDHLKDPAIVLKAKLLGGVTTERVITENLTLSPVLEIPFQVPADLLDLTLTLRGTVTPRTGGDPLKLEESETFLLNADLTESRIGTACFSPTAEGYRLEVRGRNGEALPSRAITLSCRHEGYLGDIEVAVRTDASGRIDLGPLTSIQSLTASGTDIGESSFHPRTRQLSTRRNLAFPAGAEIRLPLENPAEGLNHLQTSLLETLGGNAIRDHFDKLSTQENELIIRDLPPGDFELRQSNQFTKIRISSGRETQGLLVAKSRIMPLQSASVPTIDTVNLENDELRIQLRNVQPTTRVTVIGKRYRSNEFKTYRNLLPFDPPVSGTLIPGFLGCEFLKDKRLSDEMRYILERRDTKTFPGSMLPRPGLLLNRWTEEDLDQGETKGLPGLEGTVRESVSEPTSTEDEPGSSDPFGGTMRHPSIYDFLLHPAHIRFDLTPDADGSLKLPLAEFKGSQFLEIVATDSFSSDVRVFPLPANETPLRDRRIARPLDPAAHYIAGRSAAVLQKDAEATLENLLDADWRAFTTLTEAHQFLFGITADDRLREFIFLTEWPTLPEAKKLEFLSKHACHEFHLFLSRKDRPFFEQFVKPLLAGKPEPRFMDDFLLGRDLSNHLRPFAWQRLNAAEKALLSQALPATRERIAKELSLRWELEAPSPDQETALFTQTLRGSDLALEDSLGLAKRDLEVNEDLVSAGVPYLTEKLRRIIIPQIDFKNISLEEAINFLRQKTSELDTLELDPSKKGINIVTRKNSESLRNLRIQELRLRNVPVAVALKYICGNTKLRYKVDDYAVTIVPATETGDDIFTRTFQVPSNFVSFLSPEATRSGKAARKTMKELLTEAGIVFGEGSSLTLGSNGMLIVTTSATELDKVEQLVTAATNHSLGIKSPFASVLPEPAAADPFASDSFTLDPPTPSEPTPTFPERTRLYREANYYKNTHPTDETLIPLNRFWLDLAAWNGQGPFLSPHFNACSHSAADALMCLALLDLPFKAERPEVVVTGTTLRVKAREPMLLFYKDTRRTENVTPESPLLARQTFSPLAEPFRKIDGREVENPVIGEFRPGVPYSASLVVTNPTGMGRRIDLLAQIPAGSIPLDGKPATLSSTHEIAPYGVVMSKLSFYFPAAGDFATYPLHVSSDGSVLAHTPPRTLRVSNEPATSDTASWGVIAADGSNEQILQRLGTDNLDTLDLGAIRWRLKDPAFFLSVAKILRERLHFSDEVMSFGFMHNDTASIREFLENSESVTELGQWLDSPLLDLRPRTHLAWETLEFDPLVNPRAHRFAGESRFTHEAAKKHYQDFLKQLAWKPKLDASDHLTLAAFLFLQDRIEEGLARFDQVDPTALSGSLNYDYLHAVVLFHREQAAEAKAIATRTLPTLPPGLWRERFQAVSDQADEVTSLTQAIEAAPNPEETPKPHFHFSLDRRGDLLIKHLGPEKTTLRLFNIDLEVLFSQNPFLQEGTNPDGGVPSILPNASFVVPAATIPSQITLAIPPELRQGNVLISTESGSTKRLQVLDSQALEIRRLPLDRIIQVMETATAKPLPKTYVKVYAETRDGTVTFHKDGYTDLRGKFDYLSHTGMDSSTIKRVAILVKHPEKGARTTIHDL